MLGRYTGGSGGYGVVPLRRAGGRESFRHWVRRLGSNSDSIRSSRSCPHTVGTRLSLPRPSSECAAAPSAVLVQRPCLAAAGMLCYWVLWRLQAVISRVLNDNPRAHRLLPRGFVSNVADFHDLAFHRMAAMFVAACAAVVDDDDYVIVTDSMKLPISRNAAAAAVMASACSNSACREIHKSISIRLFFPVCFARIDQCDCRPSPAEAHSPQCYVPTVPLQARSSSSRATGAAPCTFTTHSAPRLCRRAAAPSYSRQCREVRATRLCGGRVLAGLPIETVRASPE